MGKEIKSKSLVEAGLMSGIVFILMMLTILPVFDLIGSFIIPIPIALLYLRYGNKIAWASTVVSGILAGIFYNPFLAVQAIIVYGIMGVILGYCIDNNKSSVKTVVYLMIANGIGSLVQFTLSIVIFSKISLKDYLYQIVDMFHEIANVMPQTVTGAEGVNPVIEFYKSIDIDFLIMILPVIFIMQVTISAVLNFIVTKSIMRKLGYKNIQDLPKFSNWYLDNKVGAGIVLLICIGTIAKVKSLAYGDTIFFTAYYIFIVAFTIQGLALVSYFLKNKLKLSNILIIFISIMIITSPLIIYLFGVGLADLIMDVRGIDPNSLGTFVRSKIKAKVKE